MSELEINPTLARTCADATLLLIDAKIEIARLRQENQQLREANRQLRDILSMLREDALAEIESLSSKAGGPQDYLRDAIRECER